VSLCFGRFLSVLLLQLEHIAFLVNRFPILISNGDLEIQGLIADAAEWRLAGKIQDYWHWAASENESSDRTRDRGPKGTAERCVKELLIV
jgi:hypothetical protein